MPTNVVPVFDFAQLGRRTMGDSSMQVEMLALFVSEAERLMRQVETAADPQVRGERLHAMIGLARNIGAARLAQTARALEVQIAQETPDLSSLRTALDETLSFVRQTGV
jgi:HPt (histidine-containing phosphotransfer) domain-containing protein